MSFFKNIFKKQTPVSSGSEVVKGAAPVLGGSQQEDFRELLAHHLERFSGLSPTHAAFIRQYFTKNQIDQILELAKLKMALSLADGEDHNIMVASPPVCFDVTTFHMNMDKVREHMNCKYGGFITLLHNLTNNHPAFAIQGCNTLCFIAFGIGNEGNWVHFANISTDTRWKDAGSLPVEFLNEDEEVLLRTSVNEPPKKLPDEIDSSISNKNLSDMQNDLISNENLTQQLLVDLFRDAYFNVQKTEKGDNYFIRDVYSVWLEADEKGRFIKFNLLFTPNETSSEAQILKAINQVNQEYIMYRVYKHDYGVEIDYFLWVEGGVSKKDIIFTYKFFNAACAGVVDRLAELRAIV